MTATSGIESLVVSGSFVCLVVSGGFAVTGSLRFGGFVALLPPGGLAAPR